MGGAHAYLCFDFSKEKKKEMKMGQEEKQKADETAKLVGPKARG